MFGPLKLSSVYDVDPGIVSRRRPLKSPASRKDAKTTPQERAFQQTTSTATSGTRQREAYEPFALVEYCCDIEALVAKGMTDDAIARALEMPADAAEIIAYIRHRVNDR